MSLKTHRLANYLIQFLNQVGCICARTPRSGNFWAYATKMNDAEMKINVLKLENQGEKLFNNMVKDEKRSDSVDGKITGDNEDSESIEEQPLDIGEHYLVRRSDDSWRK